MVSTTVSVATVPVRNRSTVKREMGISRILPMNGPAEKQQISTLFSNRTCKTPWECKEPEMAVKEFI
jgi:hypothetical protein